MPTLRRTLLYSSLLILATFVHGDLNTEEIERQLNAMAPEQRQRFVTDLRAVIERLDQGPITPDKVEEPANPVRWHDKLKVRRSAYDRNGISKPASIHFTSPSDGPSSYAIDLGVTWTALSTPKYIAGPRVEFHRNTLLDKAQDVLRVGVSTGRAIGTPVRDPVHHPENRWWAWLSGDAELKRDRITDTRSVLATTVLRPLHQDKALGAPLPLFNDRLEILLDIAFGFQYEDVLNHPASLHGSVLRGTSLAGLLIYPFPRPLDKRLQLGVAGQHWTEISESGHFDDSDDQFHNIVWSLTYFFTDTQDVGIALSRIDGDDPNQGLLDQAYTSIGLIAKFGN